jgi:hypothetical protein
LKVSTALWWDSLASSGVTSCIFFLGGRFCLQLLVLRLPFLLLFVSLVVFPVAVRRLPTAVSLLRVPSHDCNGHVLGMAQLASALSSPLLFVSPVHSGAVASVVALFVLRVVSRHSS